MKPALVLLVCLVLLAPLGYWAYRGARVFRHTSNEFEPTPYDTTEIGRSMLEKTLTSTSRVGWTLSDGSRQNAFYLPSQNGALIVYAHGSPGTGAGLLPEALGLQAAGYGALLIDLPGYGESEGNRAWDATFVESIRAAVDFASAQDGVDPGRIGGHGYSNGGSLIARAAAEDERLSAIVLVASYTRIADHLHATHSGRLPGLGFFAVAAARAAGVPVSELDTERAVAQMGDRPLLILAGGADRQIPTAMASQLQSAAIRAEMRVFPEMGHVGYAARLGETYFRALEDFWKESLWHSGKMRNDDRFEEHPHESH